MSTERQLRLLFAVVVVIGAVSFALIGFGIESESRERDAAIRAANIEGCKRNNVLRDVVRELLRQQNRAARMTSPELFPDIPAEEFERLVQRGIDTRNEAIQMLQTIPCGEVFPSP